MRKILLLLVGVVTLGIILQLVFVQTQKSLTPITIRLNWLAQAQFAGIFVAKDKEFYKNAGLDVIIKEYQDGLDQNQEVAQQKVQFGLSSPHEVITAIAKGNNIQAIAAIYQTAPLAFASLSTKHITTPNDFRGKRLSAKGSNQEGTVKYAALLNKYSIPLSTTVRKDMDYTVDEGDDLKQNRTDVTDFYRIDKEYLFDRKGIDYTIIYPEQYGIKGYGDVLITSNEMIKQQSTIVQAFTKATLEGWQYTIDHPEEALVITQKYQNKEYADRVREKNLLQETIKLIQPTGGKPLGSMEYVIWNESAKQLQNAGLIPDAFDVTRAYTTQFINK